MPDGEAVNSLAQAHRQQQQGRLSQRAGTSPSGEVQGDNSTKRVCEEGLEENVAKTIHA